jgi:hypothetical protein
VSKRVEKLAGKIAARMLAASGVQKSAGGMASVMPVAVAEAMRIVAVEKAQKRTRLQVEQALQITRREVEEHARHLGELLDAHGARVDAWAEAHRVTAGPVPGASQVVERGWRQFDPQEDVVGRLVPKQSAPQMNGHGSYGVGVAPVPPPQWHPEAE